MRAADPNMICPYTGLRAFTEEESLYFKGRDLQTDQVAALLEQNKFLMVTGASGEGKSSLIYGGLVPNVRAGFFRAQFNNWIVADFRPERDPVGNMSASLSRHLDMDAATVETELRRGYSSLADLYLNSPHYIDEQDPEWQDLDETARKLRRRSASNLLVIVDQFEEFFTNPENYHRDIPSRDAQIVVNLVLETARIALKKNLPVYVVCTMRSDYIGQCSAFRGLPEYIGFSQFFVPRLKRKDLKQVIEEPAMLSGNRISQRLVERLVYDISDGVDQLPILQHALSRIWEAADSGRAEMDLLHYAMVGGMAVDELPDEDMPRFNHWLGNLPASQQRFFQDTGLQKVIEIHANQLYEGAFEYYNRSNPEHPITQQDSKRIVALAFSCLTKIDNSRAVRNRMTLREITEIINHPQLGTTVVGGVLNIFREQGNSFLRPFITHDASSETLHPETVLDITHESLIRNWNKLNTWANKEFEYYATFQDFRKQLDRWKQSGRSQNFLLPIGPLTFFENWYQSCKPNSRWIQRYSEQTERPEDAARAAELVLSDTKAFLTRSARKEIISRTFTKYGPKKIATIAAVIIMTALTGFYWYDAAFKKNSNVIDRVRKESMTLLQAPEVSLTEKAIYLLTEERYDSASLVGNLRKLNTQDRMRVGTEVYKQLLNIDKNRETPLRKNLVQEITETIALCAQETSPDFLLGELNKFNILLSLDEYYNPDVVKTEALVKVNRKTADLALRFFQDTSLYRPLIPIQLNVAVQFWLTKGMPQEADIRKMIDALSPLAGAENQFNQYYPKGSYEMNGRLPNDFNGGYHTLASLYAAVGDTAGVFWSFRKMLEYNQRDYFELARVLNNHINIIAILYQFGHRDQARQVIGWLAQNTRDNPPQTLLRNAVLRAGYISHLYTINFDQEFHRSTRGYFFPNLYLADRRVFDALLADYDSVLQRMADPNEREFMLAMNDKRKAIFYHKYWYDRKMPQDQARLDAWLDASLAHYRQVDPAFLEATQSSTLVYNGDGVRTRDVTRKTLYLYPDYRDGWFSWTYHSDYFFHYLKRKGLLEQLYRSGDDLQHFHYWIAKAFEWKTQLSPYAYSNQYELPDSTLLAVLDFIQQHPEGKSFDVNLPRIVLANRAFSRGDTAEAMQQYRAMRWDAIKGSMNRYEYLEKIFFSNMINDLATQLVAAGKTTEGARVTAVFEGPAEKTLCYFSIAERLYRENADPRAFQYLDSGYRENRKINYAELVTINIDPRYFQIQLLSEIGSQAIHQEAANILRDLPEGGKYLGVVLRVMGIAYEGNYYRGYMAIPSTLTQSQDLQCRTVLLNEACRARERASGALGWRAFDHFLNWNLLYHDYFPT